jgi:Glutathione S-transferase, N-terminal domain
MNAPILHHYPGSPFAEKIRTILGFKKLAWRSVLIPIIMPKPDVVALTGGIALGETVNVMPIDTARDPVQGTLLTCTVDEIALQRTDPRAGTVVVHFPRFGFQLARAT